MNLKDSYHTVVIGGGQAGLSASVFLQEQGIDHVVLERHRVAHAWRSQRWDNFCLVTPNWQCTLPHFAYHREYGGSDPDGFMKRDEIVRYIEAFRESKDIPVVEGVQVDRVWETEEGLRLTIHGDREIQTHNVIVATGGYHTPKIPAASKLISEDVQQLHSSQYKNAESLPEGDVLVVGTGQSGCQIAEDLHLEGRSVCLAVGRAPRAPRYYRGRDVTAWLVDMGAYDVTVDEHPMGKAVRKKTNHYLTGRDGGREIDLRRFAREGMDLRGRFLGIENEDFQFDSNLAEYLDNADASSERIKNEIDRYIEQHSLDYPSGDRYEPVWVPEQSSPVRPMASVSSVIWCTGFDQDFSWIELDAFEDDGEPIYQRGVSSHPGLYFLGLPWMHTWGSGRFSAIADDAHHVVDHLAERSKTVPISAAV